MIIKIAFDTEFEPDRESLRKVFKALGLEEAASVARITDNLHAEPKVRRGRPPKAEKDIYQVARERIAERSK